MKWYRYIWQILASHKHILPDFWQEDALWKKAALLMMQYVMVWEGKPNNSPILRF